MAAPSIPGLGYERSGIIIAARRDRAQHEASIAAQQRRRSFLFVESPPAETTTLRRHVLQSDFANVVGSPSPGAVEVEVVFDGDQIRFYVVP